MKINETTSFPYPVLSPWSDDITGATISTEIKFREDKEATQVSIHCSSKIDQPQIRELIGNGQATFGCYVRCIETGLRRLEPFGFPEGVHHFAPGAMLGNVHIRPMVWTTCGISAYSPDGLHPEFVGNFDLGPGAILAIDDEQIIEVSRPPLPTVESIFEITSSEEVPENEFRLDLGADRVTVRMGRKTYDLVQKLRQTDKITRIVNMNSLYVPMVMQMLWELSESDAGFEQYEGHRWLHPFRARCEQLGIALEKLDPLTDAQKLLGQPFSSLETLVDDNDGDNDGST